MKIQKENLTDLESTLTVTIEKADYENKYLQELKKYRNKAHIKGFRKGKTPLSALKKMYGKSVLAEVVNEVLQKSLTDYITEEKLNLLGNPIPNDSQDPVDFNLEKLSDYTFKFDIGEAPDFEVKGVNPDDSYDAYKVAIEENILEEELEIRRKRLGDSIFPEEDIEANDILTVKALELTANGEIKEKGWETGFTLLVNRIADEKLKNEILQQKMGDKFRFDIYKLEKDVDEKYVKKYLLNLDEEEEKEIGNDFEAIIEKVSRIEAAELNQDFFDKAFGEQNVTSKEEALESIKTELRQFYENQEKSLTYREILESLVEANEIEIPAAFLKRWLKNSNENVTDQNIEEEFEGFEKNLKWTLIKNELAKKYNLKVEPQEVKAHVQAKIASYMGQYQNPGVDLDTMTNHYLQNREQVEKEYEEILANKIFKEIELQVNLVDKEVTSDEFKDLVKEINEKLNKE